MTTGLRLDLARAHILTTASLVVSGGTLAVYQNDTTTPVSLFSDRALATPTTNPIVADSAGRFPVAYTNTAQLLTLVCEDASGNNLWTVNDYEPFLGSVASVGAAQIANNAVSFALMQQVTGPVFIGRIGDTPGNMGAIPLSESIIVAASDEATAITTGTSKVTFRMPYAFALTAVRGSLSTAQSSGAVFTFDVKNGGASIFSATAAFPNNAKTTVGSLQPGTISGASLADDAEITIDVTQIGDGTAKGLKVCLIGSRVV